jgi:hypothetical protein
MPVPDFSPGEVLTAAAMDSIGLWLVKTQTIGTGVSSVTVSNAFSASYDNYLIKISGGSGTQAGIRMTLGATATGYYSQTVYGLYTNNTVLGFGPGNSTSWGNAGYSSSNGLSLNCDIFQPFATARTWMMSGNAGILTNEAFYRIGGFLDDATSYTAFTLAPASGTLTGGTIRVYGYRN